MSRESINSSQLTCFDRLSSGGDLALEAETTLEERRPTPPTTELEAQCTQVGIDSLLCCIWHILSLQYTYSRICPFWTNLLYLSSFSKTSSNPSNSQPLQDKVVRASFIARTNMSSLENVTSMSTENHVDRSGSLNGGVGGKSEWQFEMAKFFAMS